MLGRSPECQVTIEDPLVSRRHARILIRGDEAHIEDLGSRNGIRVNGQPIGTSQSCALKDGDRIRIGMQELVFCRLSSVREDRSKQTGFLRHCAQCRTPYPEELVICPSCGASDFMDEDTLTGAIGNTRRNWTLQLLVEVLDKALSSNRPAESERVLVRAKIHIDELLAKQRSVDLRQVDAIAGMALRLTKLIHKPDWASWALELLGRAHVVPSGNTLTYLEGLPKELRAGLSTDLQALVKLLEADQHELSNEVIALQRLQELSREGEG